MSIDWYNTTRMKTVGELLKQAREERQLTLEEISAQTKIQLRYLRAIEENRFEVLPASAFAKGLMRNFSISVGLDPTNVLAIFRRDYGQDERGKIVPRSMVEPIQAPMNIFNPRTTTIFVSVVLGILIIGFFIRQAILFTSAPSLSLEVPTQGAEVTSPVVVRGHTDPQAVVTVNNRPAKIESDGTFQVEISLTTGEHTIVVAASSRSNKTRVEQVVVVVSE